MVSDVSEESIGLRNFQIRKERAVERAVEKVRHKLGEEWQEISSIDIDTFVWALGETWAMMGYNAWNNIRFSNITLKGVNKIIELGQNAHDHKQPAPAAFDQIHALLDALEK